MAKGNPGKGWSKANSKDISRSSQRGAVLVEKDFLNQANTRNQGPDGTTGPTPATLPVVTQDSRHTGKKLSRSPTMPTTQNYSFDFLATHEEEKPSTTNSGSSTAPDVKTVAGLNADALIALQEKARKEEKDKLYPEIEKQKDLIKKLQADLEAAKVANKGSDAADPSVMALLKSLEAEIASERRARVEEKAAAEVALHREKVLRQAKADGHKLIEDLVEGKTVEEINASLEKSKKIAKAHEEEILADLKKRGIKTDATAPDPNAAKVTDTTAAGVPSAVGTGAPADTGKDILAAAGLDMIYLTSRQAIANGDYQRARGKIQELMIKHPEAFKGGYRPEPPLHTPGTFSPTAVGGTRSIPGRSAEEVSTDEKAAKEAIAARTAGRKPAPVARRVLHSQ